MATLTNLDEKLAEVLGLAQAAQQATKKVGQLAKKEKDTELVQLMGRMGAEAAKVEADVQKIADTREGLKSAIAKEARDTKKDVVDFMKTYLEGAEALDGLELLTMTEAGELIHWEIVATLNENALDRPLQKVIDRVLPLQREHIASVREHALRLAGEEDPAEEA